jgi:hypothetical protein
VERETQRERELTNDKFYERKTEKLLEKIMDRLARAFVGVANPNGCLVDHAFDLVDGGGNTRGQVWG